MVRSTWRCGNIKIQPTFSHARELIDRQEGEIENSKTHQLDTLKHIGKKNVTKKTMGKKLMS